MHRTIPRSSSILLLSSFANPRNRIPIPEKLERRFDRYVNNAARGDPVIFVPLRKPPLPPPRLFSSFPFSILDPPLPHLPDSAVCFLPD